MLSRLRAGSVVLTCALLAGVPFQPANAATATATATTAGTPAAAPTGSATASHTNPVAPPASLASVSAMPGQTGQQLTIPVAPGLQPARITGSIAVAGQPTAGTVRVSAQGRTLLEAPAKGTIALDAAVSAADLTGGQLVLALEYTPAVRDVCTATQSTAALGSLSLTTQGTEAAPTTAAEFLAPSVPAVLIPVPADPSADVSAAILAASAAMAHRYPDAALRLAPPQDVDAQAAALPAGSRIITITAADGAAGTTLGTAPAARN